MRRRGRRQAWLLAVALLVAGCGNASLRQGGASPTSGSASTAGTTSAAAETHPSPIRTCGSAPRSSGAMPALVGITVTGPPSAVSGETLTVQMHVLSLDGKPHRLETGNAYLLLVRDGRVVGQYEGAVAGNGVEISVPSVGSWPLDVAGRVSGCPVEPLDDAAPDLTRQALPPGDYGVVVVLPDVTAKPFGELVSTPMPIHVVADPHALPTCGTVPASTQPPQSRIAAALTGPATARAGSTARVQVMLRANRGRPETLTSTLPITVLIVRNGYVVGRTDGPVAGVGVELTVPASGETPLLHPDQEPAYLGEVAFSGCPQTSPTNGTVVSPSPRAPLPPGPYQVVAVVKDGDGVLVTQPFDVQVS